MSGTAIRLVFKSRSRLLRDAMTAYLATRADFTLVGQTGELPTLAELCRLRRPDAVLVDVDELTESKVEELQGLRKEAPDPALIVTYAQASPRALQAAVAIGVTALVPRCRGLDVVLRQVRGEAHPHGYQRPDGLALTDSDLRVMSLLSSGHSVPEMAGLLQVGARTIENHKRRLYMKLGVGSSGQAVAMAGSLGLVDPPWAEGQPRPEEAGRAPLTVLSGQPCPALAKVRKALLKAGLPFVHTHTRTPLGHDHWAQWQRGAIVVVLIDPAHDDWLLPAGLGAHIVVVDTAGAEPPTIVDVLLRGATAVVRSADIGSDLISVIQIVIRGYLAIDASHLEDLAGWMAVRLVDGSPAVPELTSRECDALYAIADGHTIRQTARLLGIAAKTVENTQARLYRKLGARNRMDAVTIAQRLGLLEHHH